MLAGGVRCRVSLRLTIGSSGAIARVPAASLAEAMAQRLLAFAVSVPQGG